MKTHTWTRVEIACLLLAALFLLIALGLAIGWAIGGRLHRDVRLSGEFRPAETEAEAEAAATAPPQPLPVTYDPDLPPVDPGDWSLRLVRSDTPLPADYEPELVEIEDGQRFDARAGDYLKDLIAAARAEGYEVYVCSGYRPYDTQYDLYWNHVGEYQRDYGMTAEEAEAQTRLAVNPPGGSEHQLGLAMDILEYRGQPMEPYIGGSGLMLWLEEHCADFGFIIRYPEGKTEITGVEYEPWHIRYVGPCAGYIMKHGLCLEEFLALYE